MVPEKGNSLVFLRMQNNLLRRLSKSLHTVFCGRILAFLASVFPISERSGVNLRGAFNTGNVTIFEGEEEATSSPEADGMVVEGEKVLVGEVAKREAKEEGEDEEEADKAKEDAMQVDAGAKEGSADKEDAEAKKRKEESAKAEAEAKKKKAEAEKAAADKRQFYNTFWSLQPLLSNPQDLFKSFRPPPAGPVAALQSSTSSRSNPSSSSSHNTAGKEEEINPSTPQLALLREGIVKTLEVFANTNKREIELSGKEGGEKGKGRGVDLEDEEQVKEHYFFPKYLTKRNLLDLEVRLLNIRTWQ